MKRRNAVKTVLRVLAITVLSAIIGWSMYSMNAAKILGNAMPMPFGVGVAVVESGSMEPVLSVGDVIVVRPQESYAVSDIVVYQSGHSLVVHRIISINGEGEDAEIITQGDANNAPDAPITRDEIKGRLWTHIPKVGLAMDMLRSPAGIIVVIAVAILLMELSFKRDKRNEDEDLEKLREEIRKLKEEMREELEEKR